MNTLHKIADLDAKAIKTVGNDGAALGDGIVARFDCVLTTNEPDRDHDVMEPSGAIIDTAMPLLWQHQADSPIGRYVETVARDSEKIIARYEVADTPLGRDSVLLMKLGILRISHGFRPLEYESRTTKEGSGYHVKRFEIVETSLVSVPANPDAQILALQTKQFESQSVRDWITTHLTQKGNAMSTLTATPPTGPPAGTMTIQEVKTAVQEGVTAALVTFTKGNGEGEGNANGQANADAGNANGQKKFTGVDLLNAAGASGTTDVRVKSVAEKYSRETRTLKHFKTGQTVLDANGREPQSVSELNYAKAGAFLKKLAAKKGITQVVLGDDDNALLELCYGEKWAGEYSGQYNPDIDGLRMKTLLSDSISGGTAAVPFWFDVDLISFPLLSGELFPYIDLRNVPRGNSVHAASVANPTVQWGVNEGTDIPLFDTASLVAPINTSITTVTCAITVGLDFLADSPADVGRTLTENVGQKLAAELDRVTASGSGTTEPTGIFTASGLNTFNADNTTTGPPTVNDYMSMMFGIQKQYRNQAMRPCFISNDVAYQRSRQIRVDPHPLTGGGTTTINQLPVMSPLNDVGNYSTLAWPHRISQSLANGKIGFGAMARYRMYRRLGFELRWVTEGAGLARANEAMLVVRGRFGGQPVDGNAFCICTDAQS
jgi:HK97 family phage major capsid protein/HK97 family phage prohead protease